MNIIYVIGKITFYPSHKTPSLFPFEYDAKHYPKCITILPVKSDIMKIHNITNV